MQINYTIPQNLVPNKYYGNLLQDLFAGTTGEVASSLQFYYQAYLLLPHGIDLGTTFLQIAKDDKAHEQVLAETIVFLGCKPQFKTQNGHMLSARSINTECGIKNMLLHNITQKENIIINYKNAISKISSISLKKILTEILNQEKLHLKILKNLAPHAINP